MLTHVVEVAVLPVLDMLAVTPWLSRKPRKPLNWQNRRERLLVSSSLSPLQRLHRAPIAILAQPATEARIKHLPDEAAALLMAVVKVWLLVVVAAARPAAEATSSSHKLRPPMTPIKEASLISSVEEVRGTEEASLETSRAIGANRITNNSNQLKTTIKPKTWATSI
jgi:hypothetical protein